MIKVITYGTYDVLHHGHIRLLERAKELGDYLVVGITSDQFDRSRGKINVQQSLMERVEAVKSLGIADEIVIEEYPGQKIDDIKKMGIDVFAIGSDWEGHFDYLNEYCKVIYLDRTKGISSSKLRSGTNPVKIGMVIDSDFGEYKKYFHESCLVNGAAFEGIYNNSKFPDSDISSDMNGVLFNNYEDMLQNCDAVIITTQPDKRNRFVKLALQNRKHVLCKSPISMKQSESNSLIKLSKENNVILMDSVKTAYSTAYNRLLVIAKSGYIGEIINIDLACTSLSDNNKDYSSSWNSICTWGPTAMLPVFQLMGTDFAEKRIITSEYEGFPQHDAFTKIDFLFKSGIATIRVGNGVKTDSKMTISGTKGYIDVPSPWWKTDYFELRFENAAETKRYFYELNGEGIRNEISEFIKSIRSKRKVYGIDNNITLAISSVIEDYLTGKDVYKIRPINIKQQTYGENI